MIKNLYDNKLADLVLGLFDPSRFGLPTWMGYVIQDETNSGLRNYSRFLKVLANRNGEMGGICPLFFDGTVCNFEELPLPDEINAVSQYYNRARDMKTYRQDRKSAVIMALALTKKFLK